MIWPPTRACVAGAAPEKATFTLPLMPAMSWNTSQARWSTPTSAPLGEQRPGGRSIVCTDSIAYALPEEKERNVLCTAGRTGRSVIGYFRQFRPWAFICSDGGIGKNQSGLSALEAVEPDGIVGCSVSAQTARMGDGQSTYFDGVISAANSHARATGVQVGQRAREAAALLLK